MNDLLSRLDPVLDRIQDVVAGLSRRDRLLLGLLAGFAVLVVLGGGTLFVKGVLDDRGSRLATKQQSLQRMEALAAEYASNSAQAEEIIAEIRKHDGTTLSAFLEQSANKVGIADKLNSVREKGSAVEGDLEEKLYAVELSRLSQDEAAGFLYEVETAGYPLRIQSAKFKASTSKGERVVKLTMDVSSFRVLTPAGAEG